MTRLDKLILRIKRLDKSIRFEELRKVLEEYGYTMHIPGGGSSHRVFRKPGSQPITVPHNEPLKRIYIVLVRDMIESEEKINEDN